MTDPLFFDTDCLCAFLWVQNESLLPKLYPHRIVIPKPVYKELSKPAIPHLKMRVDALLDQKQASLKEITVGSEEYETYYQLTEAPQKGYKLIGHGEAASIALAKKYEGIVASNNLSDIMEYLSKYQLRHMTTGDILIDAFYRNMLTEQEGNLLWEKMLAKRRRLGAATFSDYLKSKQC